MANKYEDEIEKDQLLRDSLILARITEIYREIRRKAQEEARSVVDKSAKDQAYFNQGTRRVDFEIDFNKAVRPDYVRRDAFSKKVYNEEYFTSYYQSKYAVENQGISKGFSFNLPEPKQKQFKEARDYALSKLMNKNKMATGRNLNIAQLEDIIVSGVQRGLSLPNINKEMDIALGFRDKTGKWIKKGEDLKGQKYQTERILRTEILRMRENARTDQWINSQDVVESELVYHAAFSNTTRNQSASMNGQRANKEGKFKYPGDTGWHRIKQSGVAKYDINCKCFTTQQDPEYKPTQRIAKNPKTGKNEIIPYVDFKTWSKDNDLKFNKYGEVLL